MHLTAVAAEMQNEGDQKWWAGDSRADIHESCVACTTCVWEIHGSMVPRHQRFASAVIPTRVAHEINIGLSTRGTLGGIA